MAQNHKLVSKIDFYSTYFKIFTNLKDKGIDVTNFYIFYITRNIFNLGTYVDYSYLEYHKYGWIAWNVDVIWSNSLVIQANSDKFRIEDFNMSRSSKGGKLI